MKIYVYDLETFPNYFSCAVCDYASDKRWFFEVSDYKDDRQEMYKFFTQQEKYFLVGYNSLFFDNIILNDFLLSPNTFSAKRAKKVAQDVINSQRKGGNLFNPEDPSLKYLAKLYTKDHTYYKPIDVMKMLFSKMHQVSLKVLEVYMNWHDVRDLPFHHEHIVQPEDREEIESYNFNDVEATKQIFKLKREEANLRHGLFKATGLDCYSKDPVNLGVSLFLKEYMEQTGETESSIKSRIEPKEILDFSNIIMPGIHFESKTFNDFLNILKSKKIANTKGELNYKFEFGDVTYSFGTGGIHSKDEPGIVVPPEDHLLIDADVASLYPSLIIVNGFKPSHLDNNFLNVYEKLKKERIKAKREGNKLINASYKLALNGTYGNLINAYSWLFDREAAMKVTLNGQLQLAMITERLINRGFKIDSINTDGFTTFVHKDRVEEYFNICRTWEKETRLELEFNLYDKIARRDVNAYFARYTLKDIEYLKPYISEGEVKDIIKSHGKIKEKGFFLTAPEISERAKGYGFCVIKKAIKAHFFEGANFEEYIMNHDNLFDFCNFQNVDKRSKVYFGNEEIQRINRYYVSIGPKSDDLFKITQGGQKTSLLANRRVMIVNKTPEKFPDDIDYQFYIQEARKTINIMLNQQLKLHF